MFTNWKQRYKYAQTTERAVIKACKGREVIPRQRLSDSISTQLCIMHRVCHAVHRTEVIVHTCELRESMENTQ